MSNDNGDEYTIPIRADLSQLSSDLQTADVELAKLQARVNQLEKTTVRAFNQSGFAGTGGVGKAAGIADVQKATANTPDMILQRTAPGLAQAQQQLAQAQQAYARRLQQLDQQAAAGNPTLPPTERQAAQSRLGALQEQQRAAARQAPPPAASSPGRPLEITAPDSFFDRLARANVRSGLNSLAARAAGGRLGAVGDMLGMMGDAAGMAGVAGPMGAAVAAVGGVALAVNQSQVEMQQRIAAMGSALVGGPAFGNQALFQQYAFDATGASYGEFSDPTQARALQLAQGGVRGADLTTTLASVYSLAKPNQLDQAGVTGLATQLGTTGGLSGTGIASLFSRLETAAKAAGVPLSQVVDGMEQLGKVNARAAEDVGGLAAVQRLVGPSSGVSGASLLQPLLTSTGGAALQQAAVLGMTGDQFQAAQTGKGGTARLYDAVARFVKRTDTGPNGLATTEAVLQQTGLLNTNNLQPSQLAAVINGMRTAAPGQAQATYERIMRTPAPSASQYLAHASAVSIGLTPATTMAQIYLQNAMRHGTNLPAGSTNLFPAPSSWPRLYGDNIAAAAKQYGIPAADLQAQLSAPGATRGLFNSMNVTPPAMKIETLARQDKDYRDRYGSMQRALNAVATGNPSRLGPVRDGGMLTGAGIAAYTAAGHGGTATAPGSASATDPYASLVTAAGGPGNWQTDGGGGSWGAGTPPPQRLEITVTVRDQSGRQMGHATTSHTLTPASSRLTPGRTVVGGRTHGPGR